MKINELPVFKGTPYKIMLDRALGVDAGSFLENGSSEKAKYTNKANRASQENGKKRKRALKSKDTQMKQKKHPEEGTTYAAGEFASAPACSKA